MQWNHSFFFLSLSVSLALSSWNAFISPKFRTLNSDIHLRLTLWLAVYVWAETICLCAECIHVVDRKCFAFSSIIRNESNQRRLHAGHLVNYAKYFEPMKINEWDVWKVFHLLTMKPIWEDGNEYILIK